MSCKEVLGLKSNGAYKKKRELERQRYKLYKKIPLVISKLVCFLIALNTRTQYKNWSPFVVVVAFSLSYLENVRVCFFLGGDSQLRQFLI